MTKQDPFLLTKDYFDDFWTNCEDEILAPYIPELQKVVSELLETKKQGDFPRWHAIYRSLKNHEITKIHLKENQVKVEGHLSAEEKTELRSQLMGLYPWRKGPFNIFDIHIDSEWQSWMKWERLAPHLPELQNKRILDIGCGNGYYLFRMAAEKPKLMLGVDPSLLFLIQFMAIDKYIKSGARILPVGMDALPEKMPIFDLVFSMGVFYHRHDPIGHLRTLKKWLTPKGELFLETLVIEGDENQCLIPQSRYAQMRNVWFLPSVKMLETMIKRAGFRSVECLDISDTTIEEQRQTDWTFDRSLVDYLNADNTRTLENHPPPKRAILRIIQ